MMEARPLAAFPDSSPKGRPSLTLRTRLRKAVAGSGEPHFPKGPAAPGGTAHSFILRTGVLGALPEWSVTCGSREVPGEARTPACPLHSGENAPCAPGGKLTRVEGKSGRE